MKNDPTTAQPSESWLRALRLLDADLRRRGMAERTRRAYGIDAGQLAVWCTKSDLDPADVTPRVLRRYAQVLSERRAGPATTARKLAALRQLYRVLHEHGEVPANPADLVVAPKRPAKLPRVLAPTQIAALLERIPATTPLELRDRALFELAYACGLRAEELVDLDVASVSFEDEELRV
jgi:site-specific recombinase XerD